MTKDLKNICFHKARNVWYIKFVKHNQKFEVTAATLEEAIDVRDRVRDFIAVHNRIPNFEKKSTIYLDREVRNRCQNKHIDTNAADVIESLKLEEKIHTLPS